jgi:hypothetical protein
MGIQSFSGGSASTEGIVTVKITGTSTITTLPVPFSAGVYRADTGYNGQLSVSLYDASDVVIASFLFTTTSMFTIPSTATKIGIACPSGALNGVVAIQSLKRGVNGITTPLTTWSTKTLANTVAVSGASLNIIGNYLYVMGGTTTAGWDSADGNAVVQRLDITNPSATFQVVYNPGNTSINGVNYSAVVGNDIYFTRGAASNLGFYKFNVVSNTVTNLADKLYISKINNLVVNSAGTKIYIFGAYANTPSSKAQVYTIASNSWAAISDVPDSGSWGSGSHRHPTKSDVLYPYGLTGFTQRYRYNVSSDTYTGLGGSRDQTYANTGSLSPNGNYFIYGNDMVGDPAGQIRALPTDGTTGPVNVTTPTSVALGRDDILPYVAATSSGVSLAINSNYLYIHASTSDKVYYTPTGAFLGGFN